MIIYKSQKSLSLFFVLKIECAGILALKWQFGSAAI